MSFHRYPSGEVGGCTAPLVGGFQLFSRDSAPECVSAFAMYINFGGTRFLPNGMRSCIVSRIRRSRNSHRHLCSQVFGDDVENSYKNLGSRFCVSAREPTV